MTEQEKEIEKEVPNEVPNYVTNEFSNGVPKEMEKDIEIQKLKKENENLKKTTAYLNKKCEEMINDKSDDVLVGLLKKKINDLEMLMEESEQEYDNQLNLLRKRCADMQKENNSLQKELLEKKINQSTNETKKVAGGNEGQLKKKIGELEDDLRQKNRQLKDKEVEAGQLKDKLSSTQIALDYHMPLSMGQDAPIKKTQNAESVKKYENTQLDAIIKDAIKNGAKPKDMDRVKDKVNKLFDEKERIMNINENLTVMVNNTQKEKKSDKIDAQDDTKKAFEIEKNILNNELVKLKKEKDADYKKYSQRITGLEGKLTERNEQVDLLGKGVETLNKELMIREDPIHNSREVVNYLDKFAKYQNEFFVKEMKRTSDELKNSNEETLCFKEEQEAYKKIKRDYDDQYARQDYQIKAQNEQVALKQEELRLKPDESRSIGQALDSWQREKETMNGLRKLNRELSNQLSHYKYLVRRIKAGDNNVHIDEKGIEGSSRDDAPGVMQNPRYLQMVSIKINEEDRINPSEFMELIRAWKSSTENQLRISIFKQIRDSTELFESAMNHAHLFQAMVREALKSENDELNYLALVLLTYAVSDKRFGLEKYAKLNPIDLILNSFRTNKQKKSNMSMKELLIACLYQLGLYYDLDWEWQDVHSDMFLECQCLTYMKVVIGKSREVGQIDALKVIALIFKSGLLLNELSSVGAVTFLLKNQHGNDNKSKMISIEAFHSLTKHGHFYDHVDKFDLIRNTIDAFFHNEYYKFLAMMLDIFLNMTMIEEILAALINSELVDRVCWLLLRSDDTYNGMKANLMLLQNKLCVRENIVRIQFHLKNRYKDIILSNNFFVATNALILQKKIIDMDKNRLIMDFQLIQTLLLNLGTENQAIFNSTQDILKEEGILSNESYLQVIFSTKEIGNISKVLPIVNEEKKAIILFNIIYHYISDIKTAGSFIKIGSEEFYICQYNWLQRGTKPTQKMILDILTRLMKYANKSSSILTYWPNWDIFTKFLTLKLYNKCAEDYEIYFSVLKLSCELSDKEEFAQTVNMITFLQSVDEYLTEGVFGQNDAVVRGQVITILGNFLNIQSDTKGPDRINKLLRNKKFNFIRVSIALMKPWKFDNPNNEQSASLVEFFCLVAETPLFKGLYQSNLATFDLEFRDMLQSVKNETGRFAEAVSEFCHKIISVFEKG